MGIHDTMDLLLQKMKETETNSEFMSTMNSWSWGENKNMRADIHPDYFESKVRCACGNEIQVRSTVKELHVDICSNCHPFYTGKQKLVDTAGRIEKFNRKYGKNKNTEQVEESAIPK